MNNYFVRLLGIGFGCNTVECSLGIFHYWELRQPVPAKGCPSVLQLLSWRPEY